VAGSATYGWVQIEGVSGSNLSWTVPGAVGNSLTTSGAAAPAMVVLDTTTATALLAASALVVVPGVAGTGIISCSFKH
ncbi:MAG: hypothetical protein ACREBW_10115, partial [Candidatus Micrarchaeaceae archaeon]